MNNNSPVVLLDSQGLPLFSWEYARLKKLAKEKGVKAEFRPSSVFVKGGKQLVISYVMKGPVCPFLKKNRCLIYEHRPLKCKSYPLEIRNEKDGGRWGCLICPSIPSEFRQSFEQTDFSSFMRKIYECFGETAVNALQQYIIQCRLIELAESTANLSAKPDEDFFDCLIKHNVLSQQDYDKLIRDAETCTTAREQLQIWLK